MTQFMGKNREKWVFYGLVIAVLLALYLFSSQQRSDSSALSRSLAGRLYELLHLGSFGVDYSAFHVFLRKSAHFGLFSLMGVGLSGIAGSSAAPGHHVGCITLGVLAAVVDETHQLFVAGRGAQVTDVILDSCGMLCGYGAYRLIVWLVRRRCVDGKEKK